MEKTEAVNKLKKAGYQVQFDSSIVTVLLNKNDNFAQEIKKLRVFFQKIGYDASFALKQMKDESNQKSNEAVLQQDSLDEEIEVGEQFSLEDFGIN